MAEEITTIHEVLAICPVCSKAYSFGSVNMDGQQVKYYCPECNARHYGEPDTVEGEGYKCGKCGKTSDPKNWDMKKLQPGEKIHGPVESCASCNRHFEKGRIALIEITDNAPDEGSKEEYRTGNLYFVDPTPEFLEALKGQFVVYISESVIKKMKEKYPDEG